MNAADAAANTGAGPVREGFAVDVDALSQWMTSQVHDFEGPLSVKQFKGGQSNPTYQLSTPGQRYVLRRRPPGMLLKGAHAVEREARVMAALGPTGVPVPKVLGLCEDELVIGSRFFVMEMVEGRIFWDATFPEVARSDRPAYFDAMNATLARLHGVEPSLAGLADFGRPGNYFSRQITRWSKQYLEDVDGGRDAGMDRLVAWLPENIPSGDESAVVHGDFRCDNLIFHPTEPRILAILDWELSTLGHPLADFSYHSLMYRMPPDIVAGLLGADLEALNIPSEEEYVANYCRRTGRPSIPAYEFYVAFNLFRLAAIFHGIRGRVARGSAASVNAKKRAESFGRVVDLACASIEGGL